LVGSPRSIQTPNLIDATNSLKKGGLYVVGNIMVGEWKDKMKQFDVMQSSWLDLIATAQWKAFLDLTIASSVRQGVQNLLLTSGVGGMKPNTVVLGLYNPNEGHGLSPRNLTREIHEKITTFPEQPLYKLSVSEYVAIIKDIVRAGKNVLISRNFEQLDKEKMAVAALGGHSPLAFWRKPSDRMMTIDSWIVEDFARNPSDSEHFSDKMLHAETPAADYSDTSSLIVMLGHILRTASGFKKNARLRVFSYVRSSHQVFFENERLKVYLHRCRIDAEILVIPMANPVNTDNFDFVQTLHQVVLQNSRNTSVIFFPLPPPPHHKKLFDEYVGKMERLSRGLGAIYLVRSNENVITTEI